MMGNGNIGYCDWRVPDPCRFDMGHTTKLNDRPAARQELAIRRFSHWSQL